MSNPIYATKLFGMVVDKHNYQPINNSLIINEIGDSLYSDSAGQFEIETNNSVHLTISKHNYRSLEIVFSLDNNIIKLEPLFHPPIDLIITDNSPNYNIINHSIKPITLPIDHKNNSSSIQKQFELLQGLSTRSYGGPASINTVSLHGGNGDRIMVMIDGVPINNEQNGYTDISQIPTSLLDNIQLFPQGSSSRFGSSAMTGVLNVIPKNNKISFTHRQGSNNLIDNSISLNHKYKLFSFGITTGVFNYKSNLSWTNTGIYNISEYLVGNSYDNIVNSIKQKYYYIWSKTHFSKLINVKLSQLSVFNNRIFTNNIFSGPIEHPTLDDHLNLQSLNLFNNYFNYTWSHRQNAMHYVDSPPGYPIDANHIIDSYQQKLIFTYAIHTIAFSNNYLNSISTNAINISKSYTSIYYEFSPEFKNTKLFLVARVEIDSSKYNTAYEFTLNHSLDNIINNIAFSISTNYKKPSLNDLYWQPFGNPNLKTEYSDNMYFTMTNNLLNIMFTTKLFYINYDNLIQWTPTSSGGLWSPENLLEADSYGWEQNIYYSNSSIFKLNLNLQQNYTHNYDTSIDSVHYGKSLKYTPRNQISLLHSSHLNGYYLTTNIKYISERIRFYSNDDLLLPSYSIFDISVGKTFYINHIKTNISMIIDNLFDKKYQSVYGYPEIGRSFYFTISIEK